MASIPTNWRPAYYLAERHASPRIESITRTAAILYAIALLTAARRAGGLDRPATGCTAHSVVSRRDRTSLRRFQSSGERRRSPVLLVPSLINRSRIWDLRPGDSFVEGMLAAGYDVYLMDWGT